MKVWVVLDHGHEEIAVVCSTREIAMGWVKDKAEETRKSYTRMRDERIAARAELDAMPLKERLRIWGMPGYGEPTIEERMKYRFLVGDFWNPDEVSESWWEVEEWEVL